MRFEDWDVLLFPRDSKIPLKEFKTNCHVVHDNEFAYTNGSYGLPTMTCFMPGLSPSTQFNISLHSWKTPDISQFTRNYSKHPESVKFEARVLIDGRLVAYVPLSLYPKLKPTLTGSSSLRSSSFNRTGPWPQLINHSFEFTKNGDLETLRFPQFRSEVLRQSYWSPADELGRIKIVISEGFPRDSLTMPIERVKNVVAFSFQHAPLDILETSGIAWPNPSMWRRTPFNPTMPVPARHHEDGAEAHLHSPRRRTTSFMKNSSSSSTYNTCPPGLTQENLLGSMPNTEALLQRNGTGASSSWADPFSSQKSEATACFDWASNNFGPIGYNQATNSGKSSYNSAASRRATSASKVPHSDVSMPDYGLGNSSNAQGLIDNHFINLSSTHLGDMDVSAHDPKAPTNTPTTLGGSNFIDDLNLDVSKIGAPGSTSMNDFFNTGSANFSSELATSLTHSLLNQPHPLPVHTGSIAPPASEVKSRKENHLQDSPSEDAPVINHIDMRKVSQSSFSNLCKESQDTSANNSPPSQSAFSGVFSHRSTSAVDFGNDLTNVANVFTSSNMDSHTCGDANTDACVINRPEKSIKRPRHFTPGSARVIDDDVEALTNSPRVQVELDDHFGEHI
ncbi:hypothetical protein F4781DRAFT_441016 [Annulohypoxylon bovei var. microspora]|nr:hypothetical protein F4781DRAFT_441016 [Annulohypoxylon bovei var. microspora]